MSLRKFITIFCVLVFSFTAGITFAHAASFCWKDSYGRGVGTIPLTCRPGEEQIGLLYYPKCGKNMKRFGFDCHSVCPAGMRDDGLFCRRSEYGRGVGYPWTFSDGFSNDGMLARCDRAETNLEGPGGRKRPRGTRCEMWGAVAYPKCKPGYSPFGCCICRPPRPDCGALNLGGQFDLSCAKKIVIGSPRTGNCAPGEEYDAGLCYEKCKPGYTGVGPVCWAQKPTGWVNCGMGAAKNSATCANVVVGQVYSVTNVALNIANAGAGSSADKASKAARLAKLQQKFAKLQKKMATIKKVMKAKRAVSGLIHLEQMQRIPASKLTEEDIIRVSAELAAFADPTGASGIVAAYTHAKCSKLFPQSAPKPPPKNKIIPPWKPRVGAGGRIRSSSIFNGGVAFEKRDVLWAIPNRRGKITNAVAGGLVLGPPRKALGICRVTQKSIHEASPYLGTFRVGNYDFENGVCETAFPVNELGKRRKISIFDTQAAAKNFSVQVLVIRPGKDYATLQWMPENRVSAYRGHLCQANFGGRVRVGVFTNPVKYGGDKHGCVMNLFGQRMFFEQGGPKAYKVLVRMKQS